MSILLAATRKDGQATIAASTLPNLVTFILTPRSPDTARGNSVRHIFETTAFRALPDTKRDTVIQMALPSIATTDCPVCRRKWLAPTLENRSKARPTVYRPHPVACRQK